MAYKKKRIIFFPVELGIAHVTRSLAIAEELKKRGHDIFFAISRKKHRFIQQARVKTIHLKTFLSEGDLSYVEKMKDISHLMPLVEEEQKVLKQYRPDIAVIDFRLTAIVSCAIVGLPTVFITGSGGLPYGCYLPNPGIASFFNRLINPLAQKAVWLAKQPFINVLKKVAETIGVTVKSDELFNNMIYIVPEAPSYLPAVDKRLRINYVGFISWHGFNHYHPHWLKRLQPNGKTIYLTFGGTGFDGKKLVSLSRFLTDKGYRVVVSSSNIAEIDAFPKVDNLFVAKYLPGKEVCKRVDAVVCHGGYGTLMQAALAGKASVSLPFNPDQLLHALRFQELGLGRCIARIDPLALIRFDWKRFQEVGSLTANDKVVDVLKLLLSQDNLDEKSMVELRQKLTNRAASQKAASIVETAADQ